MYTSRTCQVEAFVVENARLKAQLEEENAELEAAHQELQETAVERDQVIEQLNEELVAQMAHTEELEGAHEALRREWTQERAQLASANGASAQASHQREKDAEAQRRAGVVLSAISHSMVEVHFAIAEVAEEWTRAVSQAESGAALHATAVSESRELIDEFKELGQELHETSAELKNNVSRHEEALEESEREKERARRGGNNAASSSVAKKIRVQPEEEVVSGKLSLSFAAGEPVPPWKEFQATLAHEMATQLGMPAESIKITATQVQAKQTLSVSNFVSPNKSTLKQKKLEEKKTPSEPPVPISSIRRKPGGVKDKRDTGVEHHPVSIQGPLKEHSNLDLRAGEGEEASSEDSFDEFHDFNDENESGASVRETHAAAAGGDSGGDTSTQSQVGTGTGTGSDPLGAWAAVSADGMILLDGSDSEQKGVEWDAANHPGHQGEFSSSFDQHLMELEGTHQGVEIEIRFEIIVPPGIEGGHVLQEVARSIAERGSSLRQGWLGSHLQPKLDPCLSLTRRPAPFILEEKRTKLPVFGREGERKVPPIRGIGKIPPKKYKKKKEDASKPPSSSKKGSQSRSASRGGTSNTRSVSQSQPQSLLCDSLSAAVVPKCVRIAPRSAAPSHSSSRSRTAGGQR